MPTDRGNWVRRMCAVTGALWIPLFAAGQDADIRMQLRKCAVITDINARVGCYDKLVQPWPESHQPPAVEALRTEPPGKGAARIPAGDEGEVSVLSKVTSLKNDAPNKLRITLANGQIWKQTVGKQFFIRAGDAVRVAGSGWGRSFRLFVNGHPDYIQVSRVE